MPPLTPNPDLRRFQKPEAELEAMRKRLAEAEGPEFWRSLDDLSQDERFGELLESDYPRQAIGWDPVQRRDFLKLMGASLGMAGLTACTRQPTEYIVPYVKAPPEELVPGRPLFYATSMPLDGYALGLLAKTHEGRPTKLEGNPEHPGSLGATDVFAQAAILGLYDPDRSQKVRHLGRASAWALCESALHAAMEAQQRKRGAGLRILTDTVASPTLARLLAQLEAEYPQAKVVQYAPANRDNARAGAIQAFGEDRESIYDFTAADVVLSLGSDFLYTGPGRVRYARDFASRRNPDDERGMARLYVAEASPSVTGATADHRRALSSAQIRQVALALASRFGVEVPADPDGDALLDSDWGRALIEDLERARGRSLVLAGSGQAPEIHAAVHALNRALGSVGTTVRHTAPVSPRPQNHLEGIVGLAEDLEAGVVDLLVILEGNPAYNAPADLEFEDKLGKAGLVVHLGMYEDETAFQAHWHVPATHFLEAWADGVAYDGTYTLQQPVIEPLYRGRSAIEVVASMLGRGGVSGRDLVRETLAARMGVEELADLDWRRALHDGIVADTAAATVEAVAAPRVEVPAAEPGSGFEILFRPDSKAWDGRFANNAWLQELPSVVSKLSWDNAVHLSPQDARELGVKNGQVVRIDVGPRSIRIPVWILPGQAAKTIALKLGYGRRRGGKVATECGTDVHPLRTSDRFWRADGARIHRTRRSVLLATTQKHGTIEGRNLLRKGSLEHYRADAEFVQHAGHTPPDDLTLYTSPVDYSHGNQWGMVINLSACIGCNACTIACQAENNIPVVGRKNVHMGREMHWIRIDRYFSGSADDPHIDHQPVTCMQCENAPCETVCPVGATVHSADGINQMVYNRCVGTRYCSNNCPYKVRHFNFFKYVDDQTEVLKLGRNPHVTVRPRGVMEKCTYCIQRISVARIDARVQGRALRDGDIVTACQQVCPTRAITFGDINDAESEVTRLRARPLNYGMLAELNVRPRTTYLGKIINPHPDLDDDMVIRHGHGGRGLFR